MLMAMTAPSMRRPPADHGLTPPTPPFTRSGPCGEIDARRPDQPAIGAGRLSNCDASLRFSNGRLTSTPDRPLSAQLRRPRPRPAMSASRPGHTSASVSACTRASVMMPGRPRIATMLMKPSMDGYTKRTEQTQAAWGAIGDCAGAKKAAEAPVKIVAPDRGCRRAIVPTFA